MPTYHFHLLDHGHTDDPGVELPDELTARREAVAFAGAMLRDDPDLVWDGHDLRVQVTEEGGRHVCTVVIPAIDAPGVDGNKT